MDSIYGQDMAQNKTVYIHKNNISTYSEDICWQPTTDIEEWPVRAGNMRARHARGHCGGIG